MQLICNTYGPIKDTDALTEFVMRMFVIDTMDDIIGKKLYNMVMEYCTGHTSTHLPYNYKEELVKSLHRFPENWYENFMKNYTCKAAFMLTRGEIQMMYNKYHNHYNSICTKLGANLRLNLPEYFM